METDEIETDARGVVVEDVETVIRESVELIIPVRPTVLHRSIRRERDGQFRIEGFDLVRPSAFAALELVRQLDGEHATHPVRIEIQWRNVPKDFEPPSMGTVDLLTL